MAETRTKRIRLACSVCFRDDMDGITRAELTAAIEDGWRDVDKVQSYEDSIKVHDDPDEAPPGYSVFDWYTHIGLCPECAVEDEQQKGGV